MPEHLRQKLLASARQQGRSLNSELVRRLEEAAEGGSILVSESVYRQTYQLFDFKVLPPLQLKNVSRPVSSYQVVGPKDRPGSVRGLEGLRAPMIGREAEFRQVQSRIDRLVDDRQGGVVLLVGEGGMGKSRLTSEIKARLDYARVRVL
jgi:DNA-binding NtrC family response regulator